MPAVLQLKVVENKKNRISAGKTNRGWLRRGRARQVPTSRPSRVLTEETLSLHPLPSVGPAPLEESVPVVKPAWSQVATSVPPASRPGLGAEKPVSINEEYALLLALRQKIEADVNNMGKLPGSPIAESFELVNPKFKTKAPAVQAPSEDTTASLRGSPSALTPDDRSKDAHPIVSQKKVKKMQREAKRKAKKVSHPGKTSSPTASEELGNEETLQGSYETMSSNFDTTDVSDATDEMPLHTPNSPVRELINDDKVDADTTNILAINDQAVVPDPLAVAYPSTLPCTTYGKHDHWMRFTRVFLVDQLTVPLLQSFEGCTHGSSCRFESHEVPDCPFHESRK